MLHRLAVPLFLALASSSAIAQGLVQVQLSGTVSGSVEFELRASDSAGGEAPSVVLHLLLGNGTRASDLVLLIADELRQKKIAHLVGEAPASANEPRSLFIDSALSIAMRSSPGLTVCITLPRTVPAALRILTPLQKSVASSLFVSGATSNARLERRGTLAFQVKLEADMVATGAAEALVTACSKAPWLCDKPSHESWHPTSSMDGWELSGMSFLLAPSEGDWGLKLDLPRRAQ